MATGGGDDKSFLWKIGRADWASELLGIYIQLCKVCLFVVFLISYSFILVVNACAGHTDSVSSLAFSNDGQLLASGSFDGLVKIWDALGNLKRTLEGPGGGIEVKTT